MNSNQSLILYIAGALLTFAFLRIFEDRYSYDQDISLAYLSERKLCINKGGLVLFIGAIPLWIIIAFRDKSVGVDAGGTYYRTFRYLISGEFAGYRGVVTEFGYMLLNRLCIYFSNSYHLVLFVTGTITWVLFYIYITKNSTKPSFSFLIFFLSFFYFHQFNVIRQLISIGIVLFGFHNIYERKFISWIVYIAFAMTFHSTVIILLPLYFLYNIRVTLPRIIAVVVGSKILFSLLIRFTSVILVGTKYYSILYSTAAYESGYAWADLVSNSLLLIVGYILYDKNEENPIYNFNLMLQLVATVIAINSNNIPIPYRLLWYANCNTMIFIPLMIERTQGLFNRLALKGSLIALYIIYFAYDWWAQVDAIQEYAFYKF